MRALLLGGAVLLLAACSTGEASAPTPDPSDSASESQPGNSTRFEATFTAQSTDMHHVGRKADHVYGWTSFEGATEYRKATCGADLDLATDEYQRQGSMEGFLTLTCSNGELGMRITGVTTKEGNSVEASGQVDIIGGTEDLVKEAGRGDFTGQWQAPPGGQLTITTTLFTTKETN